MKLEFARQIFEKYIHKNLIKMRPVAAELLHADAPKNTTLKVMKIFRFSLLCRAIVIN